ncbi:MAG: sulfur carrier protein ThiS adenylyltransferase ThiF [Candidatus Omnitrophota bacterium]
MNDFEKALVDFFGVVRFKKIQKTRVGVAGLGGLGSNCAAALARSGFRLLTLCDFDTVAVGNLNRQWYFSDQLGLPKTQALGANLLRINPDLELTLVDEKITEVNAGKIFSGCDAVVEAFDRPECKKMLAEVFWDTRKLFVTASGLAGWGNSDALIIRQLKENVFVVGDGLSEATRECPPCAPRVMVAAAKEADIVLSWVLRSAP